MWNKVAGSLKQDVDKNIYDSFVVDTYLNTLNSIDDPTAKLYLKEELKKRGVEI